MTQAPIHYLKAAKTSWSPPSIYVLDTETRTVQHGDREVYGLRLWCAKIIDRRHPEGVDRESRWTRGTTAEGLAMSIDNTTTHRPTLWLFAHNLAFDLATTQLPLHLIAAGWEVGDFALSSDTPWMRMHRGRRSLTLVDSVSFLPASIKEIGKMLGIRKPPLPHEGASEAVWLRRCRADVNILATALCQLMDWHDREGRGFWSVSGTATAWGHMRRRLPERTVVIDPDVEEQNRDRAALYGGRRECRRVGTFRGRRYLEIDLAAAYPTAASMVDVPVRRGETFDSLPIDHPILSSRQVGILAQCAVRTDAPRYPLRLGDATWYPTGCFTTVLAGPELAAALRAGHVVSIGPGQLHELGRALAPWSAWIRDARNAPDEDTPPVVKHSLRTWGRTVIGRFASHTWTRTELGPAPGQGWHYEPGVNGVTGRPGGMVDLGGRRWWTEQGEGADNAYPAVTAWIESAVRLALGQVIDAVGWGAVVVANTDGLIVAETALGTAAAGGHVRAAEGLKGQARTAWVLRQVSALVAPLRLIVKRSTTNLAVLGPQHVRFGAQRKLAGIPRDATEDAPGEFAFRAWPTLTWQMSDGDERGYTRPMMLRKVDGPYPAGWVLDDGSVVPPHAVIDSDGCTRLLSWQRTPKRPAGRVLAGAQHPYLDGLL